MKLYLYDIDEERRKKLDEQRREEAALREEAARRRYGLPSLSIVMMSSSTLRDLFSLC